MNTEANSKSTEQPEKLLMSEKKRIPTYGRGSKEEAIEAMVSTGL